MHSALLFYTGVMVCFITHFAAVTGVSSTTKAGESTGEIPHQGNNELPPGSGGGRKRRQVCTESGYRTASGVCNNVNNVNWGAANQPFSRLLPAVYDDNDFQPRAKTSTNTMLPSPRAISTRVHFNLNFIARRSTAMLMQWGQFLAHDIVSTSVMQHNKDCCDSSNADDYLSGGPCFPITIPPRDRHFRTTCMNFTRSDPVANSSPRNQYSSISSFIDASNIYGSSDTEMNALRDTSGGRLRVEENNGQPLPNDLLPNLGNNVCELDSNDVNDYCFSSGDERVNVFPGLSGLHTLFMREHNRIVAKFASLHQSWDDEKLFQEARKIVGAEMQAITYREWLPLVIGDRAMSSNGLGPGSYSYDANLDPTLYNVFATAAFRFGHTAIPEKIRIGNVERNIVDLFFRPKFVRDSLDDVITGLLNTLMQRVDAWYVNGMTDHMFETSPQNGLDIVSLNIQRGRDHAIPPLNDWREKCGLNKIESFRGREFQRRAARDLSRVYEHPDDVDLYSGAISEQARRGVLVGPTYVCLLGEQFKRLKHGDRYFFETTDTSVGFTPEQQTELRKISLARVICDNTNISALQRNAMRPVDRRNRETTCTEGGRLESINLDMWK